MTSVAVHVAGGALLFGPDYLLSPVTEFNATEWPVYLPALPSSEARWVHHYSNTSYRGGATVRIECPGQEAVEVITEMGGRFRFDEGEVDGDCTIVVTKPGYRNRRYAVGDVCVDALEPGGSCEAVSMTAHLVPSRVPPPLEEAEP